MLDFLEYIYGQAHKHIQAIVFNQGNALHRTIMSLYVTIMEQTYNALVLLRAGQHATLDIILRSTLEAYVDLINLCNDPEYLKQMQASFHDQWIKLAAHGVRGGNPFLIKFENSTDASNKLAEHRAELTALGVAPMNIADKFKLAGFEQVYQSVYNSLCNESHNNIRALTLRHFRFDENRNPQLVMFAEPDPDSLNGTLSGFLSSVSDTTHIVHCYFNTKAQPDVEQFREEHTAFIKDFEAKMQADSPRD
ncbi:DUF5677 domain-containing protein [Rhizobium leguminosarum]|jgi:hypothetical protein|uniref:DUF5677 domain-containing protein n=1 Tax=Rhizobium leguminosarum TaxID=384 RepID=UPI0036DF44D2